MATLIEQQPLSNPGTFDKVLPVGQEIIYTVSNSSVVSSFTRVKFIAEVHISSSIFPNPNTTIINIGEYFEPATALLAIKTTTSNIAIVSIK